MAVLCMASAYLPLAFLFALIVIWQYSVRNRRKYLLPGSPCVGHHMVVLCMALMQLPLAWVSLGRLSHASALHGVRVNTFGKVVLASVIMWLYSVWRQRNYLWPGPPCVGYHMLYSVCHQRNDLWPGSPCVDDQVAAHCIASA